MKNPIVIFAIIAVVVVLGFGAYAFSQKYSQSDSMMKKDEAMTPKEETSMEPTDAMMKKDDSTQKVTR
ncbi:MAG: hypothetical protein KBC00_02910 [Candidatus Levybacteria bacterium]|nr:hypothetical protein [Candidatus Levybacteria bacterium]MBP9815262.1 hypothetical protein [Candidatus Levybacteria bacterium]